MTHSAAVWFKRCFLHSLRCVRYCGRHVVVHHGAGQATAHPFYAALLADLGADGADPNRQIYLLTVSRALPGAVAVGVRDVQALSRQEMREMVRDAFDNPIGTSSGVGRPCRGAVFKCGVRLMGSVVFRARAVRGLWLSSPMEG